MMAAGWQQHHRIPAFGDWNYPRDDDDGAAGGVYDWPPVTPCFDFASAMRTTARPAAAQQVCNTTERSSMAPNARRMRVPAFGEWNHNGDGGGGSNGDGDGAWPAVAMTPFFDLATAPQKAPKTQGRRRRRGDAAAAKLDTAAERQGDQGHMQTRRSKVADAGAFAAAAAARRSCFTVAKPVDDDLYGVPPDMLYGGGKPSAARKDGWLRILRLLGCSCLNPW